MKNILNICNAGAGTLILVFLLAAVFAPKNGAAQACDAFSDLEWLVDGVAFDRNSVVCSPVQTLGIRYIREPDTFNSCEDNPPDSLFFLWTGLEVDDNIACVDLSDTVAMFKEYGLIVGCRVGEASLFTGSITVVDIPDPEIVVESCSGNMLILRVENELPANGFGVVWRQVGSGGAIVGMGQISDSLLVPTMGIVTVSATINYSSSQGNVLCSNTAEFTISSDLLPDLTVESSAASVCENAMALVTAMSGSGSVEGFRWEDTESDASGDFEDGEVMLPPGDYEVFTVGPGCNGSEMITIGTIMAPAKPTVSPESPPAACPDETVTLTASGGSNYVWMNANMDEVETSANFDAAPGTYTVTQTNAQDCISDTTQIRVPSKPAYNPSISVSDPPPYCEGELVTLTAENLPAGATANWGANGSGAMIEVDEGGEYTVTYSGSDLCDASDTLNLEAFGNPPMLPAQQAVSVASGTPTTVIINLGEAEGILIAAEDIVTTNASISGFQLSGNTLSFTPTASPGARALGAISFKIIPLSAEECEGPEQDLLVRVIPDVDEPFIPEIISPNGDGSNDEWSIAFPEDGAGYDIVVYSRGGAVVFEGSGSQMPWDAGGCPNGVYYYQITERGTGGQQWQGALTIIGRTNN